MGDRVISLVTKLGRRGMFSNIQSLGSVFIHSVSETSNHGISTIYLGLHSSTCFSQITTQCRCVRMVHYERFRQSCVYMCLGVVVGCGCDREVNHDGCHIHKNGW